MAYPSMTDYQDVLQDPGKAFSDSTLKGASVATSPLGLPVPMSGGFAITYRLDAASRSFAVRCFHREIPGVVQRYAQISKTLAELNSAYFAQFDFQPAGILVNGARYPIVKMDWMQGETLDAYLDKHAADRSRMLDLRTRFTDLSAWLEGRGVAHGDLQNGNVIVGQSQLKLIDYDGMYVPGMPQGGGTEVGHKHFQHPDRTAAHFGPSMDRFSFITIDLSLEALAQDPSLHRKFREGGEAIIFKANDFADPDGSAVFDRLRAMPALKERADRFAAICAAPIGQTPTLADYLQGRNIPARKPKPIAVATAAAPPPKRYICAYPVLAGADFPGVLRRVGDRVEIVGQVISVKQGIGQRGRGKGLPYVFINFGIWNQQSVKITIWSEGLKAMSSKPTQSWVGRWLSVTGLIEPPYEGKNHGRAYTSVGVTLTSDGQLITLTEAEAKFRLQQVGQGTSSGGAAGSRSSNAELLGGLGKKAPSSSRQTQAPAAPVSPNAALLASLGAKHSSPSGGVSSQGYAPYKAPQTPSPAPTSSPDKVSTSWLVWVVLIGFAIFVLARCEAESPSRPEPAPLTRLEDQASTQTTTVVEQEPPPLPAPTSQEIIQAFDAMITEFQKGGPARLEAASLECHASILISSPLDLLTRCLAFDEFSKAVILEGNEGRMPPSLFQGVDDRQLASAIRVIKDIDRSAERVALIRTMTGEFVAGLKEADQTQPAPPVEDALEESAPSDEEVAGPPDEETGPRSAP